MSKTLVLGGARSGKSRFAQMTAEALAEATGVTPVMIVTAEAFDEEMHSRISHHQADRGERWRTLEAPMELAQAIGQLSSQDVAVVDCLTLWLSNQMLAETDISQEVQKLVEAVASCPAHLWLVSNEVGWSLVPENALGRRFRDEAGRLHQRLSETCSETYLIAAGMKLRMEPF